MGAHVQSAPAPATQAAQGAQGAQSKAPGNKPAPGAKPPAGGKRFGAPAAVTVATVALQDVPVSLQAIGSVVALNQVSLRAEVTARVQRVVVQEGQRVAAGTLLFELDDSRVRADLD
ncbi:MAG: biotin/lipoyl-binding protein, partial [Burkholderiaceae bacterium]